MIIEELKKEFFTYLILDFGLTFIVGAAEMMSFVVKGLRRKFSTGVAKMNSKTPDTSNAPVPTSVCFNILITGFTCVCLGH